MSFRTHKAFTLVELLVVIAIISILAALLLPALETAMQSARKTQCAGNQHQLHLLASFYSDDFGGWLPSTPYRDVTNHSTDGMTFTYYSHVRCGTFTPPTDNPSGWYQFAGVPDLLTPQILTCPSQDTEIPNPLPRAGGWIKNILHYGYRYNSVNCDNGAAEPQWGRGALEDASRSSNTLFNDAAAYRRDGASQAIRTETTGWMRWRWAHVDGGNTCAHDGSVAWVPNYTTAVTQLCWPTSHTLIRYATLDELRQ